MENVTEYVPEVILGAAFLNFAAALYFALMKGECENSNQSPQSMAAGLGGHYGNGLA